MTGPGYGVKVEGEVMNEIDQAWQREGWVKILRLIIFSV
jgi:hypothetical protein